MRNVGSWGKDSMMDITSDVSKKGQQQGCQLAAAATGESKMAWEQQQQSAAWHAVVVTVHTWQQAAWVNPTNVQCLARCPKWLAMVVVDTWQQVAGSCVLQLVSLSVAKQNVVRYNGMGLYHTTSVQVFCFKVLRTVQ